MALKPPMPSRQTGASAPPASITSWRPLRMRSSASPTECAPEAQALLVA